MSLFNRIFRRNMVQCPRCLGKGHVDMNDIKRLKKELFWSEGKCAYCNGIGRVPPDRIKQVDPGFEYLTNDLPSWERHKVINNDPEAFNRAEITKKMILEIVQEIEHLYYIENKEVFEIADHFLERHATAKVSESDRSDLIRYIEKVINSKLGR
jgi:hypothetical protein